MVKIAVLGAGVVGLSSAVAIQKTTPHAQVTIMADKFGSETLSSGAGGYFRPNLDDYNPEQMDIVIKWIRQSWEQYSKLATSPQAAESGNGFVMGVLAYHRPYDRQYSLWKELAHDFHRIPQSEFVKMGLGQKYEYGYSCTTIVTQTWKYIGWLMKRFKEAGGTVQHRTVNTLSELCSEYDVAVNCCGLRSEIAGDYSSFPVKGHLVLLRAPWWRTHFFSEDDIYIIPHEDKLIVGGIRQKGNFDLTPDPAMRERILSRAVALFPQLEGATVVGEWCGLRPARSIIRLEKEALYCGPGNTLPVVHNYGHGGHGVTLSWGCGLETASHVQDIVRNLPPRARL